MASISVGTALARGIGWSVSRTPGTEPSGPVSVSIDTGKAIGGGLGWSFTRSASSVPVYGDLLPMTLNRKRVVLTLGSKALALELPRKKLRMEIES